MKKFLGLLLTLVLSSTALADFTDVSWENIYKDAILNLQQKQVVQGYKDGSFGYERDISRAEILKILVESKRNLDPSFTPDLEAFKQACFNDVSSSDWFSKYVCYAKDAGLVSGFAGNMFKPTQSVTTAEALKMAMRNFDLEYPETTKWYKGMVLAADEKNIIPIDTEYFHFNFKRGQMADLITRIENVQMGTLDSYLGDLKDYRVTYDTLRNQDMVYNEVVTDCKAPYILRMLNQTAFYFQNDAQACLTIVRVFNNSLDDVLPEMGLKKYKTADYYTVFYKTNISDTLLVNSLLELVVNYSDSNSSNFDTLANQADYRSRVGTFYVNFPSAYDKFNVVEYPLYTSVSDLTKGMSLAEKKAINRLHAIDKFESVEDCKNYNFPSVMMFTVKDYYEYCKEMGFRR